MSPALGQSCTPLVPSSLLAQSSDTANLCLNTSTGATCTATCLPGFVLAGTPTFICYQGAWVSITGLSCGAYNCLSLWSLILIASSLTFAVLFRRLSLLQSRPVLIQLKKAERNSLSTSMQRVVSRRTADISP